LAEKSLFVPQNEVFSLDYRTKNGMIRLLLAGLPKKVEERIMRRKGFTLVDLIVVIAVIVLTAILVISLTERGAAFLWDSLRDVPVRHRQGDEYLCQ
jgi:hypothetical protein